MYGAALYRLRERDFDELQHYDGISPAWPITYEDMAPYYTEAGLTLKNVIVIHVRTKGLR